MQTQYNLIALSNNVFNGESVMGRNLGNAVPTSTLWLKEFPHLSLLQC